MSSRYRSERFGMAIFALVSDLRNCLSDDLVLDEHLTGCRRDPSLGATVRVDGSASAVYRRLIRYMWADHVHNGLVTELGPWLVVAAAAVAFPGPAAAAATAAAAACFAVSAAPARTSSSRSGRSADPGPPGCRDTDTRRGVGRTAVSGPRRRRRRGTGSGRVIGIRTGQDGTGSGTRATDGSGKPDPAPPDPIVPAPVTFRGYRTCGVIPNPSSIFNRSGIHYPRGVIR